MCMCARARAKSGDDYYCNESWRSGDDERTNQTEEEIGFAPFFNLFYLFSTFKLFFFYNTCVEKQDAQARDVQNIPTDAPYVCNIREHSPLTISQAQRSTHLKHRHTHAYI